MKLSPFLLDQWLAQKDLPNSPVKFDLGSSTGPRWTLRELLALSSEDESERLLDTGFSIRRLQDPSSCVRPSPN